jgi:hypothetical protein
MFAYLYSLLWDSPSNTMEASSRIGHNMLTVALSLQRTSSITEAESSMNDDHFLWCLIWSLLPLTTSSLKL